MKRTANSNSPLFAAGTRNRSLRTSALSALKGAIIAGVAALSPAALAMGLGDAITVSHLGDALKLTIPLTDTNGWRDDQIHVALSSDAAHIARNMTAELQSAPGGYQIIVRSSMPVREPYLALSVAVRWPAGNLRRDYDLVFDPPGPMIPAR